MKLNHRSKHSEHIIAATSLLPCYMVGRGRRQRGPRGIWSVGRGSAGAQGGSGLASQYTCHCVALILPQSPPNHPSTDTVLAHDDPLTPSSIVSATHASTSPAVNISNRETICALAISLPPTPISFYLQLHRQSAGPQPSSPPSLSFVVIVFLPRVHHNLRFLQ